MSASQIVDCKGKNASVQEYTIAGEDYFKSY